MMGWIKNGPKKKWGQFFVRQQLPAKTEKVHFRFNSLIWRGEMAGEKKMTEVVCFVVCFDVSCQALWSR
jgi:hypothetical protein